MSMEANRHQVDLTHESRVLLASMLREEMRTAVAEGIQDALTHDAARQFTLAMLETMQEQAAQRAGLLVLGGLRKLLGIAALVLAGYMLAGAPAAKAIWAALTKG